MAAAKTLEATQRALARDLAVERVQAELRGAVAEVVARHGTTAARLAKAAGIPAKRLQSMLDGTTPMTLDALAELIVALEVTPRLRLLDMRRKRKAG